MTESPGPNTTPPLEIAHVLFMDIVAYSTQHMDRQQDSLHHLQEAVRNTPTFVRAQAQEQLIRLPTGDGMALVFFQDPEAPVRCAQELSRALHSKPDIKLRMGIHTGPVYRVADINANRNVAGGGINMAQRVMDCGDAGHILVSSAEAEVLSQVSSWCAKLHDLGDVEVKHGVHLHLYNLYADEIGNPEPPKKIIGHRAELAEVVARAKRRKRATFALMAVPILLSLAFLTVWLFQSRKARALNSTDTIVIGDFTNTTGDPVFDDALRQGLSVQLEQSPFLSVISDSKVNQILKLMGRSVGDRLTPELTREVCQRLGSKALLTGSIARLGTQYVIGLRAVNCNTGDILAVSQQQAAGKEAVLKALDRASLGLRTKLGESLSSVQKYDTPLWEATTPSLDALKAYSLGRKAFVASGNTASLAFYKRAVELDPNFAIASASLAVSYTNLNEVGRAAVYARKAYDFRDKVSERERFNIDAFYYLGATGELEKAAQTYELWQQTYPRDVTAFANLGVIYFTLGRYEKALENGREAMRLEPNSQNNYLNVGAAYTALNRLDEGDAVFKQAAQRNLQGEGLLGNRYQVAFLKGDSNQMTQLAEAAMGKPGTEDLLLAFQADTEGWYGRLKIARELTRRAVNSAERNDAKESAATYQAEAALREVEPGNLEMTRADANAALKLASNRDVWALAGLALARAGDTANAQKLAVELNRAFPMDTLAQRYWLPTIRAAMALEQKHPNRAVELLEDTSTLEFGSPTNFNVVLCPIYIRGEAYLALRDGNRAAAEFQKFIDHPGVLANFPWGALARVGLARAYVLQGESSNAKAAYQNFLTLWKDADPDIPILKQAKAEYAKLQ